MKWKTVQIITGIFGIFIGTILVLLDMPILTFLGILTLSLTIVFMFMKIDEPEDAKDKSSTYTRGKKALKELRRYSP